MDYDLPEPNLPEPNLPEPNLPELPDPNLPEPTDKPERLSVRLHPGCLGLLASQVAGLFGSWGLYVWLEATNARGWDGIPTIVYGVIVVWILALTAFVVGVVWGIKRRREHRRSKAAS